MIKNETIIHEQLQRTVDVPKSEFDIIYTKTTVFMLASVGLKRGQLHKAFVNAFVRDQYRTHLYRYPLFLTFKLTATDANTDLWKRFHKSMEEHPYFVHYYVAGRTQADMVLVYVLEVPDNYQDDYKKFLEGRYSEFSEEYKALFSPFVVVKQERTPNMVYKVIYKDVTLREELEELIQSPIDEKAELWSPPDVYGRETLQWPEANSSLLVDR